MLQTLKVLRNIVEIYIPVISFSVMFCAFIVGIFYRYVLDNPLTWPFEVSSIGFLWAALFGAVYAMRTRSHIAFDVVYDLMSPRVQRIARLVSNGLMFVGFSIALYPTYHYIQFMHTQQTPDFQIPFNVVYAPFALFCLTVSIYSLIDLWQDIRSMFHHRETLLREGQQT
ncbi:TRAP transporter small permease [Alicyclobacillus sp. SO9]|uniref:TRAP transporter small permease n=1 Tax=Alicyclobacillus sp. SO9 TaxID=2665646 RepID=UPI0018E80D5D|nr:TRAP transporter small permease [Alicyclobacillus sp. SO9]QQE80563.1 TRAP transporter small permease [Alicyclobacillus sp. SO9]